MVRFKIDDTDLEAAEGSTLLEAARKAGITIPTLCHKEGLPHYTSCMVCMVKERQSDKFLPSCSALVQESMDIITTGDEVKAIRKKAVELLLSEHRAECEAPCRIVCPSGLNIPLMNRLLAAGNIEGAMELSRSELTGDEIKCITCPGYCENACRRKKVDTPVSIRNMQLFVYESINKDDGHKKTYNQPDKENQKQTVADNPDHVRNRFSSRIGRLEDMELREWLRESNPDAVRHRDISGYGEAGGEAGSCMHCDCRAAEDCRLRDLAQEFSVKDPRGKITGTPLTKKINHETGLIFESAKCVKCALCVRIYEDDTDNPSLGFLHRGFMTVLSEPLTESFDNVLKTRYDECISICPTGALSWFGKAEGVERKAETRNPASAG